MRKVLGYSAILSACIVFGVAFVPQRTAMQHTGPFTFVAARFLLGGLCLALVAALFRRFDWPALRKGALLGAVLFLAATAQQLGMQYTTATNGGFITGLYLLFVPLQVTYFEGKRLGERLWIGAMLALTGLALLSVGADFSINRGDLWILLCAFLFAQQIILVDKLVDKYDFLNLAIAQFLTTGILALPFALTIEVGQIPGAAEALPEIVFTGVVSVGFAYTAQLYGQRYIPASQAAVLFSSEAIFAALAGWYFLEETLTVRQVIGTALMFGGLLLACSKGEEK